MENSLLDLLGTSLIPELSSDISTGTSCNVHLILVTVATVRALPDKLTVCIGNNLDLSVISAALAVV